MFLKDSVGVFIGLRLVWYMVVEIVVVLDLWTAIKLIDFTDCGFS